MASETSGSASGTVLAPSMIMAPMRSARLRARTSAAWWGRGGGPVGGRGAYVGGAVGGGGRGRCIWVVLVLTWGVRDLVHAVEGSEEAVTLALPVRGAGLEAEDVAEEIVRRRVLVEAADEIGDGAVEIFGADHGRVEKEATGAGLHGA